MPARRPVNLREPRTRCHGRAVGDDRLKPDARVDLAKRLLHDVQAGHDARLLRQKHALRAPIGRHNRVAGDVRARTILFERTLDEGAILR